MYLNSTERSVEIVRPGGMRRGDAIEVYFEHIDKAGLQEPLRATFRSAASRAGDWHLSNDWFVLAIGLGDTDPQVTEYLYRHVAACRQTLPWRKRLIGSHARLSDQNWASWHLDFAIRPSFNAEAYRSIDQSRRGILAIGWWLEVVPIIDGRRIVPLPSSQFRIPWTIVDVDIAKRVR